MKALAVVAVAFVVLSGWTSARSAEVSIAGFVFGCKTLEGSTLKPKYGDIEGASYSGLPAQRQECLNEIQQKIARCRDNIDFGSHSTDWDFAECLPVFREQAQVCVGHFERERAKCGGASTRVVALDSNERWRLQKALAAAGFDPGQADGKFGPKTHGAIQRWQQANGYQATGDLTTAQVEALLDSLGSVEGSGSVLPFGPGWAITDDQSCQVYIPFAKPENTITWSGGCVDGKALGEGKLLLRIDDEAIVYEGAMREGKAHGYGIVVRTDKYRYEGRWRDNLYHGHGTKTWVDGRRYEGDWRDGKRTGRGIFHWADGHRYEGDWRDNKRNGNGTIVWDTGNRYTGDWRNDKKHGRGTYTWADGERYEGDWRDDKAHGRGTYIWADGGRYEGEWRDDKRNGYGTIVWADGERYEGDWRDNKRTGRGTYTWADGARYEGGWRDNKRNGKGTFTWADGTAKTCDWYNSKSVEGTCAWH